MAYKIVYRSRAELDIWQIADYLADFPGAVARQFLLELKEGIEGLADLPLRHPVISPGAPYRKMMVGKYVVIYAVERDRREVLIMRVVHGKRDYQLG